MIKLILSLVFVFCVSQESSFGSTSSGTTFEISEEQEVYLSNTLMPLLENLPKGTYSIAKYSDSLHEYANSFSGGEKNFLRLKFSEIVAINGGISSEGGFVYDHLVEQHQQKFSIATQIMKILKRHENKNRKIKLDAIPELIELLSGGNKASKRQLRSVYFSSYYEQLEKDEDDNFLLWAKNQTHPSKSSRWIVFK